MQNEEVALVLSGGGVRGAYEAGVVSGIIDALGEDHLARATRPPFSIYAGTSIGAMNAAYYAANAHVEDLGAARLVQLWGNINLNEYLRLHSARKLLRAAMATDGGDLLPSLLDVAPMVRLVTEEVPWAALHDNMANKRLRALIVTALNLNNGKTTMFVESPEDVDLMESRDFRREVKRGKISADEVLASAALPIVFPPRKLGDSYYTDGGLRFNTPISPAIRAGADKLVVVSVRQSNQPQPFVEGKPSLVFLLGKLLHALLLDPIIYDLHVLDRFNELVRVMEEQLSVSQAQHIEDVIEKTRGVRYRRLETMVFSPSLDLGAVARERLRVIMPEASWREPRTWLLRWLVQTDLGRNSDLASYLLFDNELARRFIAIGRGDALTRAGEIRAFFGVESRR